MKIAKFLLIFFILFLNHPLKSEVFQDLGLMKREFEFAVPNFYQEEKNIDATEVYKEQVKFGEFSKDELEIKHWRQSRIKKLIHGQKSESDLRKNELIIGKILAVKGDGYLFRKNGKIKINQGGFLKAGDLIETKKDGHIWLTLIDGTLVRMSPLSIFSIETFEFTNNEVIFFHRVNLGNVKWLSRDEKGEGPNTFTETDRIFYPFFDLVELVGFTNYLKKVNDLNGDIHLAKYKYLNFYKKINSGIFGSLKYSHIISTPHLILESSNSKLEFIIDETGDDYLKINAAKKDFKTYKKEYDGLVLLDLEKEVWNKFNLEGVNKDENSKLAWFGDYVSSEIPSISIMREKFLKYHYEGFYKNLFVKDYLINSELDNNRLMQRKKYLKEYFNDEGISFLNQRAVLVKKNRTPKVNTLENYANVFFKYSNFFNRFFSEVKINFDLTVDKDVFQKLLIFNNKMDELFENASRIFEEKK